MRQHESRLRNAQQRVKPRQGAIYKCYVSDGRTLFLDPWEILKYYESLDSDFCVIEPYIYKVECVSGKDIGRKICDVVEQVVEDTAAKAARGEIHR